MYARFSDANAWLDQYKLAFADDAAASEMADNAENVVKSYLALRYPAYINLWDATNPTPVGKETPPQVVKEIASMLMASYYIDKKYSGEDLDVNDYSSRLEKRALKLLEDLRDGKITLWDKSYGATLALEFGMDRDDFTPNDDNKVLAYVSDPELEGTVDEMQYVPDRKFSMNQRF